MTTLDQDLWNEAALCASGEPEEMDFLRAIHSDRFILRLRGHIESSLGCRASVASIWVDKYPQALPEGSLEYREIGDLAIVIRSNFGGQTRQRMHILQGKVARKGWKNHGSSSKEIELYHNVPKFELFSSSHKNARSIGTFELQKDFGNVVPYEGFCCWSFLFFSEPSQSLRTSGWSPSEPKSPVTVSWPTDKGDVMPFSEAIVAQAIALRSSSTSIFRPAPPGRPLDASLYPEWWRLYQALFKETVFKGASRLTGGNWYFEAAGISTNILAYCIDGSQDPLIKIANNVSDLFELIEVTETRMSLEDSRYLGRLAMERRTSRDGEGSTGFGGRGNDQRRPLDDDGGGGISFLIIDLWGEEPRAE